MSLTLFVIVYHSSLEESFYFRCSVGYYGDPTVPGGSCKQCDCNGNVNLTSRHSCDVHTGLCYGCQGNSMGPHCEQCKEGYYGTTRNGDCKRKYNVICFISIFEPWFYMYSVYRYQYIFSRQFQVRCLCLK